MGTCHRKKTQTPPKKQTRVTLDTRHIKIDTGNIRHKTQKEDTDRTNNDRHG